MSTIIFLYTPMSMIFQLFLICSQQPLFPPAHRQKFTQLAIERSKLRSAASSQLPQGVQGPVLIQDWRQHALDMAARSTAQQGDHDTRNLLHQKTRDSHSHIDSKRGAQEQRTDRNRHSVRVMASKGDGDSKQQSCKARVSVVGARGWQLLRRAGPSRIIALAYRKHLGVIASQDGAVEGHNAKGRTCLLYNQDICSKVNVIASFKVRSCMHNSLNVHLVYQCACLSIISISANICTHACKCACMCTLLQCS